MQKIGFCDRYSLTHAVLNGKKTMTRRVIKDVSIIQHLNELEEDDKIHTQNADIEIIKVKIARYKVGEVVAVAQSYKDVINTGYDLIEKRNLREKLENELGLITLEYAKGWNNKLFVKPDLMPNRIQIMNVRIERLQDISNEDCLKEGVVKFDYGFFVPNLYRIPSRGVLYSYKTPREAFATLINRPGVGRKGLWESNPWVVVYEFKLVK